MIFFQPDSSIADEYAQLEAAGVRMTGRISEHSWGRIAPFKDSEGNDLQLYAPPPEPPTPPTTQGGTNSR